MSDKKIFLLAKSGNPAAILGRWREEYYRALDAAIAFRDEIGAVRMFGAHLRKPSQFSFPKNSAPEGWLKPGKDGRTSPMKANKAMRDRIAALPWPRPEFELLQELGLPTAVKRRDHDYGREEGLTIDWFHAADLCWAQNPDGTPGPIFLVVPDYDAVIAEHGEDVTWLPEGSSPAIPDGFERMTRSEMELVFAQAKVEQERYDAQAERLRAVLGELDAPGLVDRLTMVPALIGSQIIARWDCGEVTATIHSDGLRAHPPVLDAVTRVLGAAVPGLGYAQPGEEDARITVTIGIEDRFRITSNRKGQGAQFYTKVTNFAAVTDEQAARFRHQDEPRIDVREDDGDGPRP